THWPLTQLVPLLQMVPQVPQLFSSSARSVHWPLQQPAFARPQTTPQAPQLLMVFRGVQVPLQQPCPVPHGLPHLPQLVVVSNVTQLPLQSVVPGGQDWQRPFTQDKPAAQRTPQPAQVLGALDRPVQRP